MLRVSEIARALGAPWEGCDCDIHGAAPLETATAHDLSFAANRRAAAVLAQSKAGCILAPAEFPAQADGALIRVPDPRAAFARVVRLLYPLKPVAPGVHPSAVVAHGAVVDASCQVGPHAVIGTGAEIGEGTSIGPGCSIGESVRIGNNCTLYAGVTLYEGVLVGNRAVLHSGCVVGADGFGFVRNGDHYEKFPQIGRVEIGDDVEIGANACVDRAALGVTRIGNGTKLDNMVHVGHNCNIGKHVLIAAQTGLAGGVVIEDYAVIGGQVGIGDKARIEAGAVLGSGAGVLTSKIVRSGDVMWGTPARPLKEHLEQLANLARLPEMRQRLAALERQLREFCKTV